MTVTQVRQMAADSPPKPPSLAVPARRRRPKSPGDVSEDDLGIFEDDAECDDLTDSEADLESKVNGGGKVCAEQSSNDLNLEGGQEWKGSQEEGLDTSSNNVKIEVSISRRSKVKDNSKPAMTELSLTLTPRSDRSEESYRHPGFRAKTNTPVGAMSERTAEYNSYDRQSQGGGSASREAMFQQALTLMSQRCVSVVHASLPDRHAPPAPLLAPSVPLLTGPAVYPLLHPPPLGQLPPTTGQLPTTPRARRHFPRGSKSVPSTRRQHASLLAAPGPAPGRYHNQRVLYVNQTRPTPMPPLKAWRGFSGNVYFEPIKVKSVSQPPGGVAVAATASPAEDGGVKVQPNAKRLATSEGGGTSDGSLDGLADLGYAQSSTTGPTFRPHLKVQKAGSSSKSTGKPHKMVIVDKGSVYSSNFDNLMNSMSDDIEWIIGANQSTGSLCVQPPAEAATRAQQQQQQPQTRTKDKKFTYNRERICRGSVAHRAFPARVDLQGQEMGSAFTAKSMTSSNPRLSPLRTETKSSEKENNSNVTNKVSPTIGPPAGPMEVTNSKLPPLDSSRGKSKVSGDTVDPLASLALDQTKSSEQPPLPKDKPYVKYSRTSVRQSNN